MAKQEKGPQDGKENEPSLENLSAEELVNKIFEFEGVMMGTDDKDEIAVASTKQEKYLDAYKKLTGKDFWEVEAALREQEGQSQS